MLRCRRTSSDLRHLDRRAASRRTSEVVKPNPGLFHRFVQIGLQPPHLFSNSRTDDLVNPPAVLGVVHHDRSMPTTGSLRAQSGEGGSSGTAPTFRSVQNLIQEANHEAVRFVRRLTQINAKRQLGMRRQRLSTLIIIVATRASIVATVTAHDPARPSEYITTLFTTRHACRRDANVLP